MSTAQEVINKAAKKAGVLARNGQSMQSGINADILDMLNMMLARWRNEGVDLGVPTLLAADEIIIDEADEECIVVQLALRIISDFNRPPRPGLAQAGLAAFTELQAKYEVLTELSLDPSLTYNKYTNSFNINTG